MTDVSINVTGEMDPPIAPQKDQLSSLLQFPTQLPKAKEWILNKRQSIRPWSQFVQTSNFKFAPSVVRLSRRILRNIEYFQANYLFIFIGLIIYCLVSSPSLLIAIAGSFYAGYRLHKRSENHKLVLFGRELTIAQQYGLVALCSLPVYYIVGAGAVLFWVIGASCFVITLHAALYNIDALISEGEESFGLMEEV